MNISRLPLLALLMLLCTCVRAQNTPPTQVAPANLALIEHELLEVFSYESSVLEAIGKK